MLVSDEIDWAAEVVLRRNRSRMRMTAHVEFDAIWEKGLTSRSRAYRMLAEDMGVDEPKAHFGSMEIEQLEIALPAIRRLKARLEAERAAQIGQRQPYRPKLDIRPTPGGDNRPSFKPVRHG